MTNQTQSIRRRTRNTVAADKERSRTIMERGAIARKRYATWPFWYGVWSAQMNRLPAGAPQH